MATFDIINNTLYVAGSLDRAEDKELQQALEKYAQAVPAQDRVVDMSNVRWLAPTGGRVLMTAGAETSGNMRVMASRHVLQTLNLLGAKTAVKIESCLTPNPIPGKEALQAEPAAAPKTEAPKSAVEDKPAEPAPAAAASAAPAIG
jgi:anti-anti-sigma regulatory factor